VTDLDVPRDQELERAVLHSIMVKPELLRRLSLPEGVFFQPKHRAVYNAMNNCDADGYPPDLVNVCANMRANGADERSIAYAASILDTGAVSRYAESYAERIKRLAYRRAVLRVEADCIEMAQRPSADAEDIERFRRREMDQAREDYWPPDRAMEPEEGWHRLREFYGRVEDLAISTGFDSLDAIMGDLHPQSVVTVLARPGVGKSVLGLNLVANWLLRRPNWGVLFASLEMGDTLAVDRLVRIMEGWYKAEIVHHARTNVDPPQYTALAPGRLCWFTQARRPLSAIEFAMDDWERRHDRKIRVVVIDYFQYLAGGPSESAYERSSRLSRELKEFAKTRDCVVVNLCQVKRGEEGGGATKCPSLEGARDSGTIEENADVLLGMWKPNPVESRLFLRALKARQGAPGRQAELLFAPENFRLSDGGLTEAVYEKPGKRASA
jgi:replicative DNA helicase